MSKWYERLLARLRDQPISETEIIYPEDSPTPDNDFTPHALRVSRDIRSSPDWKELLRWFSPSGEDGKLETGGGYLLTVMRAFPNYGIPAPNSVLVAAFRIALRYGLIRSAGKLLDRILDAGGVDLDPEDIISFSLRVRDCSQLDPFGMRASRYGAWKATMLRAVAGLRARHGPNWVANGNAHALRYVVHELCINRSHSLLRSIGYTRASLLYDYLDGSVETDAISGPYQQKNSLERRIFGLASWSRLVSRIRDESIQSGRAPVLASVLMYGDYSVSIIAIGADATLRVADVSLPEVKSEIASLQNDALFWFKANLPLEQQIAWGASFRRMAVLLCELHDQCWGGGIIKLATGPGLAGLPWQHLLISIGRLDITVVLIPAWSNTTLHSRPPRKEGVELILSSEESSEIKLVTSDVHSQIRRAFDVPTSCVVVVGHGTVAEKSLPEIDLGNGHRLTVDGWLDLSSFDLAVIHACHGGAAIPILLDQVGGSVGLLLGLGVRTLVAPVSEVRPRSAIELNRQIFSEENLSIFQAYRAAILREPECALYNLYGDPFVSLSANHSELDHAGV